MFINKKQWLWLGLLIIIIVSALLISNWILSINYTFFVSRFIALTILVIILLITYLVALLFNSIENLETFLQSIYIAGGIACLVLISLPIWQINKDSAYWLQLILTVLIIGVPTWLFVQAINLLYDQILDNVLAGRIKIKRFDSSAPLMYIIDWQRTFKNLFGG